MALFPHRAIFAHKQETSNKPWVSTVGWGRTQAEPGFGATYDSTSVKAKSVNLIASVRTVMRSTLPEHLYSPLHPNIWVTVE